MALNAAAADGVWGLCTSFPLLVCWCELADCLGWAGGAWVAPLALVVEVSVNCAVE